jgi:hypothetical protein
MGHLIIYKYTKKKAKSQVFLNIYFINIQLFEAIW